MTKTSSIKFLNPKYYSKGFLYKKVMVLFRDRGGGGGRWSVPPHPNRSFLLIWSHLLKKSLIKNLIFYAVLLKNLFSFMTGKRFSFNAKNIWLKSLNNSSTFFPPPAFSPTNKISSALTIMFWGLPIYFS